MRAFLVLPVTLVACSGQAADLGLDAQLSVRGGTFVRGAMPEASSGPIVEAAFLGQTAFPAGHQLKSFTGALGAEATAVLVELEGDAGYSILPAGPPSVETPLLPSFDAPLSFSRAAATGPQTYYSQR